MSNEELEDKSNDELRELATSRGLDVRSRDTKADMIALLRGEPRPERESERSQPTSMYHPPPEPKSKHADNSGKGDGGAAQVAAKLHGEQRVGYHGYVPDETPNEAYTLTGQGSGEAPEEDEGIAEQPS